jgi:predicted dehydrogenase
MKTIIIGFGTIAPKYVEVLESLQCKIVGIIARDFEKAQNNARRFGIEKVFRNIDELSNIDCDFYTVIVSPENINPILNKIIPFGKPILLEKPAAFDSSKIDYSIELARKYETKVSIATNRRFYSIFHKALKYLKEHGKEIDSIFVEAPERFSDINLPIFSEETRKNWPYCNPIHCIDLIRFFGGDLKEIQINSNPEKYYFSGIGKTMKNINFTYVSNWKSPGSWSVILYADNIRITFNPLENGIILEDGKIIKIIPNEIDNKFKPGFYSMINNFMSNLNKKSVWPMQDLEDHKKTLELIEKIYQIKKT